MKRMEKMALTREALTTRIDAFVSMVDVYVAANPRTPQNGQMSPEINWEREGIVRAIADASPEYAESWQFNVRNTLYGLIHHVQLARVVDDGKFKERWLYETGKDKEWLSSTRQNITRSRKRLERYRTMIADEIVYEGDSTG